MKLDSESIRNREYVDQLTWLRGLAAFFVIAAHIVRATEVAYGPEDQISPFTILNVFDLGSFGVVLFFALSGCTLYLSNANKVNYGNLTGFYTKRFFRIWPAFIVSLMIYIGFGFVFRHLYPFAQGVWIEHQFFNSYDLSDVFVYVTLTFNLIDTPTLFNNAYWSLPIEFQYYILFPLIVLSLRKVGFMGPLLVGVFLYFLPRIVGGALDENRLFPLAMSFCGGVLVGHIYTVNSFRFSTKIGTIIFVSIIAFVSLLGNEILVFPDVPIISNIWNWYNFISVVLTYLVLVTDFNVPERSRGFLQRYGTISYSTYLYHNMFIAISVLFIIKFNINDEYARLLMVALLTIIPTYFIAILSYEYVERPSIKLGRKVLSFRENGIGLGRKMFR